MIPRIFALVLVAALFSTDSRLRPSRDQAADECDRPTERTSAALDRFAVAADAADAEPQWSAEIASRIEQEEYRVSQTAGGLQAPNRAHNLRTQFRPGGIDVGPRKAGEGDDAWRLTWRTTRWGRTSQLVDVESRESEPRLAGERVTYAKGAIDEWYENRKEGLEQGFTIHERPSGDGPLIVAGQLGGGLRPQLSREDGAVDLLDEHGARVLRYGGLRVWDANGDELPSHLELDGIEVALVIEDDNADYPLTIDPLLTSPSWTAESDQANAEFGHSAATAGDVNGDGFSDVIVGASQFDNGQTNEGRAFLFLGSPSGLGLTPAWTAESDQASALFGVSVGSAGDVNGDGFHDVIVGAYLYDNGQNDEGRVFLYLGSATGLSPTPAWTEESDEAGSNLGYSVSTAGDVNGDGFADVIVGAHYGDNGQTDEGLAYVYHGSASGLPTSPSWIGESNQAFTLYGFSVATAGDVNGDGFADVVVGAFSYDNGQADEGRAFVYHGSATGLATTAAWTGESNQTSALYGWSVSTAGDVDGDGFSDVIVGAISYDNTPADEGGAFVYRGSGLGLATTPAWSFESGQSNSELGVSVATAGDVNGDGFADVIVGAASYDNGQTNEGRATIYRGSATGLIGATYWNADCDQAGAFFGGSVATAGDVNGDGFSDVLVGAWGFDNGQSNEGRAFVYHGSADNLDFPESWSAEVNEGARFGSSVGSAGDVNGDGFSDVIVGAPFYDNGAAEAAGGAFVYLGSAAGLATSPAWTDAGQSSSRFGASVGMAGDVNGDGFSDVIVGAFQHDNGQTNEGRAFVYLGSPTGLATSPAWTAESDQDSALFGWSVGTAGDVNGDGFSDVIVGAISYDNGQQSEGRVFVYFGSPAGLATSPAWTAESDQDFALLGVAVGTAGDVNGDGFSDVIVGAHQFTNGQGSEGRALVYHGSASGLATSPGWLAESDQAGGRFGGAVGTAGDVNGDGFSDVIVGANDYDNGQASEGRAFVYLGSFAGLVLFPSWTAESHQVGALFGTSVGTAGDVNADGFSDVIVGASLHNGGSTDEGRVYVFHGSPTGLATLSTWSPASGQADAFFGISAGTAGDANGDGFSDVIVGASFYDNGTLNEGRAFAYYGNLGDGLHRIPRQLRTDGAALIPALGHSDSPTAFRIEALGRTPAGRSRVQLQYEVEPFGTPFDGAGLVTGPVFDTGIPAFGNGSAIELSELVSGLSPGTLYHWRLRFLSDSPLFPVSPWFTLAANGSSEADLRTASASTGIAGASPVAEGAWLEPSAPNPFSTSTRFAYTLPDRGAVRLAVFDVSGREVVVLTDEVQSSGRHITAWNGRGASGRVLPSGVYFARLEFGGRVEARKVVLAR